MSLVKFTRKPFGNLVSQDFFDMDDFFDNRGWVRDMLPERFWNGKRAEPALNIKETDNNFEIELAAPGFAKKDFGVTIDDGCLNIKAEKSESEQEAIKAAYKDGILSFNLTKKEEAKKLPPKKVQIA